MQSQEIVKRDIEEHKASKSKPRDEETEETTNRVNSYNEDDKKIVTKSQSSPRVIEEKNEIEQEDKVEVSDLDEVEKEVQSLAVVYKDSPEFLIYATRLAGDCERYEEMNELMKSYSMNSNELTIEERNLFAKSFKSSINIKRDAWRVITSIESQITGHKLLIVQGK